MPISEPDHHRDQRGAVVFRVAVGLVVLVLLVTAGVYLEVIPGFGGHSTPVAGAQSASPGTDDGPSSSATTASSAPPVPSIDLTPPAQPPPVLSRITATDDLSVAKIKRRVRPFLRDDALGPHVGFAVAQLGATGMLWQHGTPPRVVPASTTKLLTTTAALATMGPQHRFTTRVLSGVGRHGKTPRIVLVGGGDPLLVATKPEEPTYPDPATLADLANQTAKALHHQGVRRVRLGYDASLFTGPAVNPTWEPQYIPTNVVSPISALWINEGRAELGYASRVDDPPRYAAEAFADLLKKQGITVTGTPAPAQAPDGATELGVVTSPTLRQIIEHILLVSDNEGAEVLLRHVALAEGRPGSTTAGLAVERRVLSSLGINMSHVRLHDGSGLSRHNRIPVSVLMQVLQLAAGPSDPDLRAVVSTLPVAGFDGSLGYRYDVAPAGAGLVRAKTGTLTGVHALAGIVLTRGGQALVFVAVADKVPVPQTLQARADLVEITTALSECGCHA